MSTFTRQLVLGFSLFLSASSCDSRATSTDTDASSNVAAPSRAAAKSDSKPDQPTGGYKGLPWGAGIATIEAPIVIARGQSLNSLREESESAKPAIGSSAALAIANTLAIPDVEEVDIDGIHHKKPRYEMARGSFDVLQRNDERLLFCDGQLCAVFAELDPQARNELHAVFTDAYGSEARAFEKYFGVPGFTFTQTAYSWSGKGTLILLSETVAFNKIEKLDAAYFSDFHVRRMRAQIQASLAAEAVEGAAQRRAMAESRSETARRALP